MLRCKPQCSEVSISWFGNEFHLALELCVIYHLPALYFLRFLTLPSAGPAKGEKGDQL